MAQQRWYGTLSFSSTGFQVQITGIVSLWLGREVNARNYTLESTAEN